MPSELPKFIPHTLIPVNPEDFVPSGKTPKDFFPTDSLSNNCQLGKHQLGLFPANNKLD